MTGLARFAGLGVEEYQASTALELARRVADGSLSPVQLTECALHLAAEAEPVINAYAALLPERARREAAVREAQARQAEPLREAVGGQRGLGIELGHQRVPVGEMPVRAVVHHDRVVGPGQPDDGLELLPAVRAAQRVERIDQVEQRSRLDDLGQRGRGELVPGLVGVHPDRGHRDALQPHEPARPRPAGTGKLLWKTYTVPAGYSGGPV